MHGTHNVKSLLGMICTTYGACPSLCSLCNALGVILVTE
jgi:hypothetical protein